AFRHLVSFRVAHPSFLEVARPRQPSQSRRPRGDLNNMQSQEKQAESTNGHAEAKAAAPAKRTRRPFVILGAVAVAVVGGMGGYLALTAGEQSTDDAQVAADLVPIATRISGPVVQVAIQDNQLVKKGDLIAQIDDADYLAKVKQAEAELA